MRRFIMVLMSVLMVGQAAWGAASAVPAVAGPAAGVPQAVEAEPDRLPAYQPRFGRARPVVAVVAENYYTELSDYVVPYGILSASNATDVHALATQPGTVRMFPASLTLAPQATTDDFDRRFPEGADYVIVPAVHRDDDPKLLAWVAAQARKGATVVGVCDGVWVLARAGLLEGRNATGHWYSFDDLRKAYPKTQWLRGKRYVADGKVVTTTGVTATIPVVRAGRGDRGARAGGGAGQVARHRALVIRASERTVSAGAFVDADDRPQLCLVLVARGHRHSGCARRGRDRTGA